uniref:NUDIX domain-containing protein n=1 Tax=Undibacterium sp. TaxID=1914977 RepID=UPI00374D4977
IWPDSGIWGGLLSLPELDGMQDMDDEPGELSDAFPGVTKMAQQFGSVDTIQALPPFAHVFTHFKLNVTPIQFTLASRHDAVAEARHVWYPAQQIGDAPLPAPVKKLLLSLLAPSLWSA